MIKLLMLALLVFVTGVAHALEPQRREVIVTHNRVWDGFVYKENFVPSGWPEMRLMSEKDNAISFVRTEEYYWPLSRQTYVAFEKLRQEIKGELVISVDGDELATVKHAPYSIVYPKGAVNGHGFLIWGDEATVEYTKYIDEERKFARQFAKARQELTRYEIALRESAAARLRGEPVVKIEPPPPLPEPSLKLVTKPATAYRVAMSAGRYKAYLRKDGQRIPGTDITLVVVDGSSRDVFVADIVPEERFTRPLPSNRQKDRIYAAPGATFFVTLNEASRFDEGDYLPLVRPQAVVVQGRDIWIRRRAAAQKQMTLDWLADAEQEVLTLQPLKSVQTQGAAFGYIVRAAEAGERPDLKAFTVEIPPSLSEGRGKLIVDAQERPLFVREVVIVNDRREFLVWLLAALPLVVGAGIWIRNRTRIRNSTFARQRG
ncbi:MAG: hypothetical protein AB3N20_20990 [Rhizobiaceae bacterium]